MTIARSQLIDTSVARWYHCVSRCVRRAFLLGEGPHDRKGWIENRLEELAQISRNRRRRLLGDGEWAFFEGRFKSVAILDDEALLAIGAYIDLNPVAAGIAEIPETSGRLHGAALSQGKGRDLGGAGRDLRSAGESCRELAGPAGETPHGSIVRPFLRRQSREAAGSGRTPGRATRRKPGWMSGPMMRS